MSRRPSEAGKGDIHRPSQIGREEQIIRWELAEGDITRDRFWREYNKLLQEGKITRNGQVIHPPPEESK